MPSTFQWKGETICQKIPVWQRNERTTSQDPGSQMFRALPIKHYRREIGSLSHSSGSVRTGNRIAYFETPGGISVNTQSCQSAEDSYCTRGSEAFLAIERTTNTSERPCSVVDVTFGRHGFTADNALRRVRSSGMIRRNFSVETTSNGYAVSRAPEREYKTNHSQYLNSRARTFVQNQFNYTRLGNRDSIPGTVAASENIYVSSSINTKCKFEILSILGNNTFNYTWIDDTVNTVTLSDGYYDVFDLNSALKSAMYANTHYFVNNNDGNPYYLFEIIYKSTVRYPQLLFRDSISTALNFGVPSFNTWADNITNTYTTITVDSVFASILGLSIGTFPLIETQTAANTIFGYSMITISLPNSRLKPTYKEVIYKPSNSQFSTQGAVTSGDRITRLKYDTVTKNASKLGETYDSSVAAANKYVYSTNNQSQSGLMMRTKKAVVKATPWFDPITGEMCSKTNLRRRV